MQSAWHGFWKTARALQKLKAILGRFVYSRGEAGVRVPGPHLSLSTKLPPV